MNLPKGEREKRHAVLSKRPSSHLLREAGSGFPLLVIPCGGLNSTVAGLATHPFNPFDEFNGEFRVIAADLRNAKGGQSSGSLEVDRPWDAYTDDHIGLMEPAKAGRRPRRRPPCRRSPAATARRCLVSSYNNNMKG
jgi:hypothetical protein